MPAVGFRYPTSEETQFKRWLGAKVREASRLDGAAKKTRSNTNLPEEGTYRGWPPALPPMEQADSLYDMETLSKILTPTELDESFAERVQYHQRSEVYIFSHLPRKYQGIRGIA